MDFRIPASQQRLPQLTQGTSVTSSSVPVSARSDYEIVQAIGLWKNCAPARHFIGAELIGFIEAAAEHRPLQEWRLVLADAKVDELPPEIGQLRKLTDLRLSGLRGMVELPPQLSKLHQLRDLTISDGTPISNADLELLRPLTNLRHLMISSNAITELPEWFTPQNFPHLRSIVLTDSGLDHVPLQLLEFDAHINLSGSLIPEASRVQTQVQLAQARSRGEPAAQIDFQDALTSANPIFASEARQLVNHAQSMLRNAWERAAGNASPTEHAGLADLQRQFSSAAVAIWKSARGDDTTPGIAQAREDFILALAAASCSRDFENYPPTAPNHFAAGAELRVLSDLQENLPLQAEARFILDLPASPSSTTISDAPVELSRTQREAALAFESGAAQSFPTAPQVAAVLSQTTPALARSVARWRDAAPPRAVQRPEQPAANAATSPGLSPELSKAFWSRLAAVDSSGDHAVPAESFDSWLTELEKTSDYKDARTRPALAQRVNVLLDAIETTADEDFRQLCLYAGSVNPSCTDQPLKILDDLEAAHVAHRAAHGELSAQQLFTLGQQLFRAQVVREIANRLIAERVKKIYETPMPEEWTESHEIWFEALRDEIDDLGIQLRFHTALHKALHLFGQTEEMKFGHLLKISEWRITDAAQEVRAREVADNGAELIQFLGSWSPWGQHLQKLYPQQFEDELTRQQDALETSLAAAADPSEIQAANAARAKAFAVDKALLMAELTREQMHQLHP